MSVSVGSTVMQGVPHEGRTTTLVTSLVGGASHSTEQLVNLQLDVNPIHRPDMDITVTAALQPLQITYDFVRLPLLLPSVYMCVLLRHLLLMYKYPSNVCT